MKYSYMYVYTRMIFAAVLSPAIKIFHRHLGPNLLIFAVKVSPTFYGDFMTYHRHFTAKKHRPWWFLATTRCACCKSKETLCKLHYFVKMVCYPSLVLFKQSNCIDWIIIWYIGLITKKGLFWYPFCMFYLLSLGN